MRSYLQFQIFAWIAVVSLGLITAANLTIDALKFGASILLDKPGLSPLAANVDQVCLASAINFDRTEVQVDCALARSMQALDASDPKQHELNEQAQAIVIRTLSNAPHESRLWLALALLRSGVNQPHGDALKMSYLTGPLSLDLIPRRLASAVSSDALVDEDLRELTAGDIRLILTARRDIQGAIVGAYLQASSIGKKFIEEKTSVLDPQFSSSLRNAK
jgi:hypothetical protein